jgi:hypothetical protein
MANDPFSFNSAGVRTIADQIASQANQSQSNHAASWKRMQWHLENYPASLRDILFTITNEHQKRLSQSYHWQLAFAEALTSSADAVDQVEAEITQSFL